MKTRTPKQTIITDVTIVHAKGNINRRRLWILTQIMPHSLFPKAQKCAAAPCEHFIVQATTQHRGAIELWLLATDRRSSIPLALLVIPFFESFLAPESALATFMKYFWACVRTWVGFLVPT
mmetsp:Transcript_12737/g.51274  ORF Transcript_12737/g.51274 Transcript_12737/m.51274 type:complete len:121 (-) Transcript_12737:431-793(-)